MTTKPNLLWIFCDELRTDALGCYGNPRFQPKTPNIDRLAAGGHLFRHAFTNAPVCVPARCCAMTGKLPEQTGVYNNEGHWHKVPPIPPVRTFTEQLADHGYRTINVGKVHTPPHWPVWQESDDSIGDMHDFRAIFEKEEIPVISSPPHHPDNKRKALSTIGAEFPDGYDYPAEEVTRRTIRAMEQAEGPWLLRASFLQPHTPVIPPKPYSQMYKGENLRRDSQWRYPTSDYERCMAMAYGFDPDTLAGDHLSEEETFLCNQYYYGLVSWLDDQVGQILQALDRLGLTDSTMVIFAADHGASLGENGMWAKHLFTPPVHRVPMIVRYPQEMAAGVIRHDIASLVDIAPTFLEAAGVERLPGLAGRDLVGDPPPPHILSSIGFGLPDSFAAPNARRGRWFDGSGWPRRACLRTDRFRFDANVRKDGRPITDPVEADFFLCDYRDDPGEWTNLAHDPRYQETCREFWEILQQQQADAVESWDGTMLP